MSIYKENPGLTAPTDRFPDDYVHTIYLTKAEIRAIKTTIHRRLGEATGQLDEDVVTLRLLETALKNLQPAFVL